MQRIPLTRGLFAIVDDEDYESLCRYKWYAQKAENTYYAVRMTTVNSKRTCVFMHRQIIEVIDKKLVDHWDLNGLNNQRKNLRHCTHSQNHYNTPRWSNNTSGFKGVSWNKQHRKWEAYITADKKRKRLGLFKDNLSAALAYNLAALELHGKFARLNELRKAG